jgi:hypothetical protein
MRFQHDARRAIAHDQDGGQDEGWDIDDRTLDGFNLKPRPQCSALVKGDGQTSVIDG